ncbi:TetR/AcrR family transcriptional regulator [Actinoplanes sp. CA-142083]|uniref:TetR/AcrR family transcriptional regulator n=1 Tax=Actinoplanes sp. CA-142083 TaxID=3239903 RepID=UPI003D8EFD61
MPPQRRDAARNRERLLAAARRLFAERGHDVPLEEVARAAEMSRTTIYRNFASREELAAEVHEDNVARIERLALSLRERDDGVVVLFDFVLGMQGEHRSLTRILSAADIELFTSLSERTVAAFVPLVARAQKAGVLHPGVGVEDVMLAFSMAGGALADHAFSGRPEVGDRLREMLHRALFSRG